MKQEEHQQSVTKCAYTVPEAGAMIGLNKNASYAAAARGEIPTIRFGKLLKVPKAAWDKKIGA
ncbi:helix-turn-helix domain-containing protein [Afipia felis]|uniref:DNA binding domain, excisionase family n=2 Tax=Afipia felis TaxID=1035 RepID=A0A380WA74_AFIFE|nr:helix-turn-helix domain-containing protein [Afipia felis]EKS28231.1 hypothetical protein HMPREF9697_00759 [Afipia felis ATCC 53690]SUU76941.1 Uncharacterised protein [Afipia felis]SUU85007.1 Uncharacterised protein [Afipia felis]